MKTATLLKRLKGTSKVYGLTSSRSGDTVRNQFEIVMDNATVFQSYNSIIAIKYKGKTYVTNDFDYSVTTSKYLKQFCGYSAKEVKEQLKNKSNKFVLLK